MGQRLNLEIKWGDKTLANAYYHWSAYTGSALAVAKEAVGWYEENVLYYYGYEQHLSNEHSALNAAIKMLEATGAGVNDAEKERIRHSTRIFNHEFKDCTSRNEGLLSVTKEGIEENRFWEEGRVELDLMNDRVLFQVYHYFTEEDWDEFYPHTPYHELPEAPFDVEDFEMTTGAFDRVERLFKMYPDGVRHSDGEIAIVPIV